MASVPDIPQFPLDFFIDPGTSKVREIEQGSLEEIAACTEAIMLTEPLSRDGYPALGVDPGVFAQVGADPQELLREIEAWEPRAPQLIETYPDQFDELVQHVRMRIAGNSDD